MFSLFFFFNDTATTEIYTLSLHDALPIFRLVWPLVPRVHRFGFPRVLLLFAAAFPVTESILAGQDGAVSLLLLAVGRSEEHTSELQSQSNLVCRLLLEKKKK